MGEPLTPKKMREWENRLGPAKVQKAITIMHAMGWGPGTEPPMWVWAEVFRTVEAT